MKKQTMFTKSALAALTVFFAVSCSSDDDTASNPGNQEAPTLTLTGNPEIIAKRGETFSVTLTLAAPAGNQELVVNRGGGFLESVPLENNATTFTYSTQTVPATAQEGDEFAYEFILVDDNDNESVASALTVSTRVYDEMQLNGSTVYNVNTFQNGTVPSGTAVKFVTGRNYFVPNTLLFYDGTSLTIEEGVHVYMNAGADAPIEINTDNGAQVNIAGTAANPVVFTSSAATPEPGDWDRLRIGDVQNTTITYVRSEFGDVGFRFADTDDTAVVNHLTAYRNAGEGFYITNGNANMKYLVAVNAEGGGFRLGDAYAGKIQFAIAQVSEVLGENQEVDVRETASPILANFTLVGPGSNASDDTHGIRMRANSAGKIYNTVVTAFPRRGLRLNDAVQINGLTGQTIFAYSYIFDVADDPYRDDTSNGNPFQGSVDGSGAFLNPFFNNVTAHNDGDPVLTTIAGLGANDFIPDAATTAQQSFNPATVNGFFTAVTYVGAVENAAGDWTRGWVKNPDGSIRQ